MSNTGSDSIFRENFIRMWGTSIVGYPALSIKHLNGLDLPQARPGSHAAILLDLMLLLAQTVMEPKE
jgi:hypothetical protein